MKNVEHSPLLTWGMHIYVESAKAGLIVSALEPVTEKESDAAPDVYRAYRNAISRVKGKRPQAPHIEFANANDDDKLAQFVWNFGPVVASTLERKEVTDPDDENRIRTLTVALQDWTELRNEQQMFRAALTLVAELERGKETDLKTVKDSISTIVELANCWPVQWQREQQLRASGIGYEIEPLWVFGEKNLRSLAWARERTVTNALPWGRLSTVASKADIVEAAHSTICELINAFSPCVYPWGQTAIEGPHWDLSFGIRPILYHILRREYLSKNGVEVCRNTDCRQWFEVERAEQHYCSEVCSRKQRQREYWETTGKNLREARLRKKKGVAPKKGKKAK